MLHGWVKRDMDVLLKWRHKLLPCMFPCMACHKNQFVTSNQEFSGALLTPSWNKRCFVFYEFWCLWKVNISRKKKEKRRKALWEVQACTLEENYIWGYVHFHIWPRRHSQYQGSMQALRLTSLGHGWLMNAWLVSEETIYIPYINKHNPKSLCSLNLVRRVFLLDERPWERGY